LPLECLPSETDAAYLAGFIDGEGSLGVYYCGDGHTDSRHGNRYYCPRLSVSGSELTSLNYVLFVWGGSLSSCSNHGWGTLIHRVQWQRQSDIQYILQRVIPYMHTKKEQAKLLLRWVESRQDRESHKAGYTDEEINIRKQLSEFCTKGRRRQDRESVTCR